MAAFAVAVFASFTRSLAGLEPAPETVDTLTMPTMMRAISPRKRFQAAIFESPQSTDGDKTHRSI